MAQTPFESYFLDLEYFILHNAYCANPDPDPLCGTEKGTCINGGTLSGNINTNNNIHTWTCKKGTQSQSCGCEVLVEGNSRCPNNYELQSDGKCKYMPKYCALKKKEQGGYTRWIHANSYCFGEKNPDLGIEEHAWRGSENVIIDDFGLWIRNTNYKAENFYSSKPDEGCISPNELNFNSDRYKNRSCVFKKYDITTSRDNGFYLDCDGDDLFADPCPGAKTSDWPTCGLIVDDRPDPVSEPKCGDSKNSCSSGNFKSNSNRSTSTSYSWTCTNGQDEVSCKIGIQCSQETSGDEDAGYCTGDGGRVYLGTSTCTMDYCKKMCAKTLAGFKECPDCCLQNRQWRVCNDTNKLSCIKEGLCSWISTSSASISLPKFEYCYKEETGSQIQKTTNSGHSWCGGLACGMTSPVEGDFFACPPNYSINAAGTGCDPAFMYCLSRYFDGNRWYNIYADYCFHKEWRVPGEKPLHEIRMNRPIQQNFHTLNELTITLTSSDGTKKYEFINFFDHYPSYSQTNYTSCGQTKLSLSSYIRDGFNRGECQLLKSGNTPNNGYIPDNGYMLFCNGNAGTHMQCK